MFESKLAQSLQCHLIFFPSFSKKHYAETLHFHLSSTRYEKISGSKPPPPVMSKLRPDQHYGAVPEKIAMSVNSYIQRNPHKYLTIDDEEDNSTSRYDSHM